MKKLSFILIALCLWAGQIRAQVAIATARELALVSRGVKQAIQKNNPLYIPGKKTDARTGLYSFQIKRTLKRRSRKARAKARKIQKTIPPNKRTGILLPVSKLQDTNANTAPLLEGTLYQNKSKQIQHLYLTAKENRLYAQQTQRLQREVWAQLSKHLPLLQKSADRPEPADPMSFLAQSIPAEVNTLAIGEVHGFKSVKQFIAQFLPLLRRARPDQEIFLFTEFLSQKEEYPSLDPSRAVYVSVFGYEPIWRAARNNNIRVIGLEPEEVLLEAMPSLHQRKATFKLDGNKYLRPVFASATGVKWRNESFIKTLEEYRAQHPDALFIIYSGGAHVNYTTPFSLTAKMDPQKTFVLNIRPPAKEVRKKYPTAPTHEIRYMWDPVGEAANDPESFNRPFLYWPDPHLARVSGANAYVHAEERFLHNVIHPKAIAGLNYFPIKRPRSLFLEK